MTATAEFHHVLGDAHLAPEGFVDLTDMTNEADTLVCENGPAIVYAGGGDDIVKGGNDGDRLDGEDGNDRLFGNKAVDLLLGGAGDDRLSASHGDDCAWGGAGRDILSGDTGDDALRGGSGKDGLRGQQGDDTLDGGDGKDGLTGGKGADELFGGSNRDVFLFYALNESGGDGRDTIHDFEQGLDRIRLSALGVDFDDVTQATDGDGNTILGLAGTGFEVRILGEVALTAADFIF